MPPRKEKEKDKEKEKPATKGRKRVSSDGEKEKTDDSSAEASTELLSPSEVVKMRKKTRTAHADDGKEVPNKEKDDSPRRGKGARSKENDSKNKEKDDKKEKESKVKERKKEKPVKSDTSKRGRIDKERPARKPGGRKKLKSEDDMEAAVVLFPCGICTKEVNDEDEAILCEAGCGFWYHRSCTGMSDFAYLSLTNEENAEWVCDKCIATKCIPLVKLKSYEVTA